MRYLISSHNLSKYKFYYKISDNCHLSTDEQIKYYHYKNEKIYVIGKIQGVYENNFLKNENIKLKKFFYKKNIEKIKNCLEGQFLIIINKKNKTTIFQDKFSKLDIFYTTVNKNFYFSNNFTDIIKFNDDLKINQYAIAHLLSSYSIRPAKKDTIFEKIKRLGVNQYVLIEKSLKINNIKFNPLIKENYNNKSLTEYFDLFIDYIKNTSRNKNKTIFMSSGFDSSFILGILTKIFNNKKIFGVTCLHYFNQRSGNYNKFEINRVKKLSKFYKIKNFYTKVNFKDDFEKMSEEISKISADKMIFNTIASFMHHRLSQLIKKKDYLQMCILVKFQMALII